MHSFITCHKLVIGLVCDGLVLDSWNDWDHTLSVLPPLSASLDLKESKSIKRESHKGQVFPQVSAYTMFVNVSLANASHMPKVVSKVREINDTDLSISRAVKSHCRRAWIKEEEIVRPFFTFTASNSKVMTLCWNNMIRYLEPMSSSPIYWKVFVYRLSVSFCRMWKQMENQIFILQIIVAINKLIYKLRWSQIRIKTVGFYLLGHTHSTSLNLNVFSELWHTEAGL